MGLRHKPDDWESWNMEGPAAECTGPSCEGDCSCYGLGFSEGKNEGEILSQDQSNEEVLEGLKFELEKIFKEEIRPFEDRLILREDSSVGATLTLLYHLLGRVRSTF